MTPTPLTPSELHRIWLWQRHMVVFYGMAMVVLALAGIATFLYSDVAWVRRTTVVVVFALAIGAAFVQFRERCPRCGSRLGSQTRLFLPSKCSRCRVPFEPLP